jgi:hypothetical protein
MKFKLKEDWVYQTSFFGKTVSKIIYKEGHVFEPTSDGEYEIVGPTGEIATLSIDKMISYDIFDKITEESDSFEIIIEEIPDDDDNLVRNWRIQLDVKTTRKKLKEVQQLIEEHIRPIL